MDVWDPEEPRKYKVAERMDGNPYEEHRINQSIVYNTGIFADIMDLLLENDLRVLVCLVFLSSGVLFLL